MPGAFEADAERLALLCDDALLALELVAERADPVDGVGRLVVPLVHVIVDSQTFVASPRFEVFDAA